MMNTLEPEIDPLTGRPDFYVWGQLLIMSGLKKNQAAAALSNCNVKPKKHEIDAFWAGYNGA